MSGVVKRAFYVPDLNERTREMLDKCCLEMQANPNFADAFGYLLKDLDTRAEVLSAYMLDMHQMARPEFDADMESESDFLLFEQDEEECRT